jgi:CubicO group peptidase (beta-lactamase class C family)
MKISAKDLATYMMMHANYGKYNGVKIISKKSSKLMQTAASGLEPYGFALEAPGSIINGQKLIGHTGFAYGLFSAMFFNPQEKYGIVVISNGCHPGETNGYNNVIRKTVNALYESLIAN